MTEIQDKYWLRPTDLTSDWARLHDDITAEMQGHSHCQVQLGIITSGGCVAEMVEPTYLNLENRNSRLTQGGNWWAVVRRIRSMAPDRGRSLITLSVVLDSLGNPVTWTTPAVLQVTGRK